MSKCAVYVVAIASNLGFGSEELIKEAERIESCGEWLHMELLGSNTDALREAALQLT